MYHSYDQTPSNLTAGKVLASCVRALLLSVVVAPKSLTKRCMTSDDARADRDSAKTMQLCRNAVQQLRTAIGVDSTMQG